MDGPGGMRRGMGPGMGRGMMGPGMGRGPGLESMQRSDPEMYELVARDNQLERETMELCEQYRRAPKKAREVLKDQLQEVVGQHFEVRQQRRQLELTRMEKELKRLNEAIKRRQEAREDIIKRRVAKLTWEEDPLDF